MPQTSDDSLFAGRPVFNTDVNVHRMGHVNKVPVGYGNATTESEHQ